jgi:hypothetical protein
MRLKPAIRRQRATEDLLTAAEHCAEAGGSVLCRLRSGFSPGA